MASAALWRPPSSFCVQAQHFRRVVLRVFGKPHCQGCLKWWQHANCVAGVGHRGGVILRGRRSVWLRRFVCGMFFFSLGKRSIRDTLHFTLYTSYFTLDTPHFALYTSRFTHCTLHSTLRTLHLKLHTAHCTSQSTLYAVHCTSTLCT